MIEPPRLFTYSRLNSDIKEIEGLASLVCELSVPIDSILCEAFERLVELAGSREFITSFSSLQQYLLTLKWNVNGVFGTGYIVNGSLPVLPQVTASNHSSLQGLQLFNTSQSNQNFEIDSNEIVKLGLLRSRTIEDTGYGHLSSFGMSIKPKLKPTSSKKDGKKKSTISVHACRDNGKIPVVLEHIDSVGTAEVKRDSSKIKFKKQRTHHQKPYHKTSKLDFPITDMDHASLNFIAKAA